MNQYLKSIQNLLQQNNQLTGQDREALLKAIADADKQWNITDFKLDRTEKVKKTTSILLEETIAELEQKRKAVEAQNRELEIEAALEKVRSESLAMRKSDELQEVVHTVSEKLTELNVDYYTVIIIIFQEGSKDVLWWLRNVANQQHSRVLLRYSDIAYLRDLFDARENGRELFSKCYATEEKDELYHYLFNDTDFKYTPDQQKKLLLGYEFATMSVALAKNTAIHLTRYSDKSFSDEDDEILKKFARVFDQAYTRFLDLQKAEAQTREAQIEAALERVRARAMAMHTSDDLQGAVTIMFEEFQKLNLDVLRCGIGIMDKDSRTGTVWATSVSHSGLAIQISANENFDTHPLMTLIYDYWQKQEDLAYVLKGKDLIDYYKAMDESELKLPKSQVIFLEHDLKPQYYYAVMFNTGGLYAFREKPFVPDDVKLMKRFASVVDLTYKRFLDLQTAEAQAREAQIEAALERVRSRTMGMQKSEELHYVIKVIYEQLVHLNFSVNTAGFGMDYGQSDDFNAWIADAYHEFPTKLYIPYFDHPLYNSSKEAKEKKLEFSSCVLTFDEKNAWVDHLLKYVPELSEEAKAYLYGSPGLALSRVAMKNVVLFLMNYSGAVYSDAENATLIRFGKVFEQTYTRFNDLKKAEEQAREAQIEAALEKVRSRSLAMHHPDELKDVITVVREKLKELNLAMESKTVLILTLTEGSKDFTQWIAVPEDSSRNRSSRFVETPYFDHPIVSDFWNAKESGTEFFAKVYTFEEKNSFFKFLFEYMDDSIVKEEEKKWILERDSYSVSTAIEKNSAIIIASYTKQLLSENENEILKRVARVFEQSYIRFLDLQKAEAQAREAQIEAALERVRAKAMAMHKTEDFNPAVAVVFEELEKLNLGVLRCGISVLNKETRTGDIWVTSTTDQGSAVQVSGDESFDIHPLLSGAFDAWLKQEDFYYVLEGNDLTNYYKAVKAAHFELPESQFISSEEGNRKQYAYVAVYDAGGLFAFRDAEFPDEAKKVMKRFANVFDLTYKRFRDLQQAEGQARESQIQLALERVRARTMAMQKSDELSETSYVLFEQWKELGKNIDQISIGIFGEDEKAMTLYSTLHGNQWKRAARIEYEKHIVYKQIFSAWKKKKKTFVADLSGKELSDLNKFKIEAADYQIGSQEKLPQDRWIIYVAFFSNGMLSLATEEPHPEESIQLLERFASVFDLTYTRFLDLKKAEAQAREATIEAALERVRGKAMAMHKSEDFNMAVATVFEELEKLNPGMLRCGIAIIDKEKRTQDLWTTTHSDHGRTVQISGNEPLDIHPLLQGVFGAWLDKKDYSYVLQGEDLNKYYSNLTQTGFKLPESESILAENKDLKQYYFNTTFQGGTLYAFRETPFTEEVKSVVKRFGGVFDLTYKRFLDLQKAEANAREAQIEASLERVRARAMAMQTSEELNELIGTVFTELTKLDLVLRRSVILIYEPDGYTCRWWMANSEVPSQPMNFLVKYDDQPFFNGYRKAWQERKLKWVLELEGNDKAKTEDFLFSETELSQLPAFVIAGMRAPEKVWLSSSFNNFGCLTLGTLEPLPDEHFDILLRFAKVFDLTYTRFSDLQLAQAQAKEATIEAALERVRGKAMAMHNTNDLSSATSTAFTELRKLGINPIRFGVGLLSKDSRKAQLYSATSSMQGDSLALVGWVMLTGHPVLESIYESWMRNEDIFPVLSGAQLKSYYEQLSSGLSVPSVPDWKQGEKQFGHFFPFSVGCLYAWAEDPYDNAEIKILKRFASIIDLTFKRYMDLQRSEESAREAVKQAALDRIRADTASMRTVDDLDRITPLIWNELTILGIPFIRCGVFIMDDEQRLIHTFLSTPEGKAIAAFHLPYTTGGNIPLVLENWQSKSIYTDHWDEEAFAAFANELVKQGALSSTEQYLSTLPKGGFYLHFLPFLQGMLYVGNTISLDHEQLNLVRVVAEAFSTAYARYEDFNRLEAAKEQIEKTLVDLKQTQQQLVQSEKMASLGELTAGIAHEIQNPLNFVNNFSEVSNELVDEMKAELATGNSEQAIQIAEDVKQNLDKILHHGKRADAIVKGMLQHSRTSSGQKELTDINVLADEYLRLAYHGLRAKDKTFNAKFETDLDKTIDKINVVPQDIGRVILNLINNAFYAVTEKKRQVNGTFEPTVSVSTKELNGKIEIRVKDNGNGIPEKVMDKIFQPFFTTKPTGQGTGLGLSLAYDIITKGHGGGLKVETVEGEGSEFIISLLCQ